MKFIEYKKPRYYYRGFLLVFRPNWVPGSVLLSHGECHTTIGATAFHFCVRHGNRWFYCALATRQILFNKKALVNAKAFQSIGGVDGTRTRDPRRDRPVF